VDYTTVFLYSCACMVELTDFISFARSQLSNQADKYTIDKFEDYLQKEELLSSKCEHFGKADFSEFVKHLSDTLSVINTYKNAVAARRLIADACARGHTFHSNPALFSCPKKPDGGHHDPLSSEQFDRLQKFLEDEINKIYEREDILKRALSNKQTITKIGKDFRGSDRHSSLPSFWKWRVTRNECVKMLNDEAPGFPNNASKKQISVGGKYALLKGVDYKEMDSPFKTVFKRMGIQRLKNQTPFLMDAEDYNFIDVLGVIYPRLIETYVIQWAICLETGWNSDSVSRIDINDYLAIDIPIKSDVVIIKSKKYRGTIDKGPFKESKEMIWPSSKSNPLSAYNLIKLYIRRSSRLRNGKTYNNEVKRVGCHPLFVYLNESAGLPILSRHPDRIVDKAKGQCVKPKVVREKLGFNFNVKQLRPTANYHREKDSQISHAMQVALFGNSSSSTLDQHYRSSTAFKQLRNDELSKELDEIQASIHNGSFKGKLVPLKNKKEMKAKIITIFTDYAGQSPLAVCSDNKNPDWTGHETEIRSNGVCRRFNKCLLCSKSQVFSDNIPFIVDRFMYIEKMKREINNNQFALMYQDEYLAAQEVIEYWPFKEEIEEAEERTLTQDFLLPPIISESFQ
jgi:hypothetical protein